MNNCYSQLSRGELIDKIDELERRVQRQCGLYNSVVCAVDRIDEGVYAFTLEGKVVFANRYVKDLYFFRGDVASFIVQINSNFTGVSDLVAEIRRGGNVYKCVLERRISNGMVQTLECIFHLTENGFDGEIVWGFFRDVSLCVQQKCRVKELNRIMYSIFDAVPVYLFVKDTGDDFRYLYCNKAFERYSQISADFAIGNTDFDIFPNRSDAERFRRDDLALLKGQGNIEYLESYQSGSGEIRTVKTLKTLVCNENREPFLVGISLDITDMKNTERELMEARLKAEQSNRLKSAFLANISHDIRIPLNAIVGFSRLISETDDRGEKDTYFQIVESNSNVLTQLINDILELSKIEAGVMDFTESVVNLRLLCLHIYGVYRQRTQGGTILVFDDNAGDVCLLTDRDRLKQVLVHLISNAIKFTERGYICFGYTLKCDCVEFYVQDTGIGIDRGEIDFVFKRFVKLNAFAQGSGLGLAISKMIVERLGGTIGVESEKGKGALFKFTLPYRSTGNGGVCAG